MNGEQRPVEPVEARARIHGALGDPHRLAIVDALAASDLAPSEVREMLAIESNLLAHHLDVLSDAGVVERTLSHGDRRRRYLHLRREALAAIAQPLTIAASGVLFVCTANSARSQLAAALWNARHSVPAASAAPSLPSVCTHTPGALRPGGDSTSPERALAPSTTSPQGPISW